MSSMAKIFVVVNLLLVVAVFGAAAVLLGAQDDYRGNLVELEQKSRETRDKLGADIAKLKGQVSAQVQKTSDEKARADDAEARLEIATATLDKAQQANAAQTTSNERLSGELASLRSLYENQQAVLTAAANDAKEASQAFVDKNKAWEEVVRVAAQLDMRVTELDDSVRSLQADKKKVEDSLRDCEFWLGKYKERFGDIAGLTKAAEGKVLEVREAAGGVVLLILSVGRDDGVTVGDEYRISRGSDFVGFAKVTRVLADKAVAEFDTQFPGNGAPARNGDRAYTK
jgi:chromosome segregation ATPase